MDIRDIYKKYRALEEQATMTVTADSAEEIASLLGMMKNAGLEQSGVVGMSHNDDEGCGCAACSGMSDKELGSWDNSPDTSMADLADITFLAGGGVNGPKHPGDIRVKDPRASENIEEWDNEPEEEYNDQNYMTKDLAGGINKAKKSYAAAQRGDNAMAVESIKSKLLKALEEKKHNRRPDSPDLDGDGDTEEPIAQAAKQAKKKKKTYEGEVQSPSHEISDTARKATQIAQMIKKKINSGDQMDDRDYNQMAELGTVLSRLGTSFGPKTMKDVLNHMIEYTEDRNQEGHNYPEFDVDRFKELIAMAKS